MVVDQQAAPDQPDTPPEDGAAAAAAPESWSREAWGQLRSLGPVGVIACVASVLILGLVAWTLGSGSSGGHSSKPRAQGSDSATAGGGAGTGAATGPGGAQTPTGSATATPSSPADTGPAVAPAASLPGVSGPAPTVTCPAATVSVSSAAELTSALSAAAPGTVIDLADGTYSGNFVGAAVGTAASPVYLCGGAGAVLDGGNQKKGYVLHLSNASYWRLVGFTVQDAQKGVVLDHTDYSVIQGLTVQQIGDEGIHLREFSDDDLVLNNSVGHTGLLDAKFGEGLYIGTAQSNWCEYSSCGPDGSDNDVARGNTFSDDTAENIDIKEGTTGGALIDNTFNGSGMSPAGASGWVNVKGNDYLIAGNTGHNSLADGFQTHQILAGWGMDNVFQHNTAVVDGTGYGFHFTPVNGNIWTCDNTVAGAARGESNISCATAP